MLHFSIINISRIIYRYNIFFYSPKIAILILKRPLFLCFRPGQAKLRLGIFASGFTNPDPRPDPAQGLNKLSVGLGCHVRKRMIHPHMKNMTVFTRPCKFNDYTHIFYKFMHQTYCRMQVLRLSICLPQKKSATIVEKYMELPKE